jgi:uncharacterized protein YdeI (YjbR/CyaY-like superfamily)
MRAWLRKHHTTAKDLLVGYYKVHTVRAGKKSLTWPESVAEALCFGWIDGIRRSLDEDRYTIRFTPRRPGSKWSAVNVRLMGELEAAGKMTDAGRAVFQSRRNPGSKGYKAQKKVGKLDPARLKRFRTHRTAWRFYVAQPIGYQKRLAWWVMQAKQDDTRDRRLSRLIEVSARQRRLE